MIVHIGYPKTATSTLQYFLFAKHSGIKNIGLPCGIENREFIRELYFMAETDSTSYDDTRIRELFKKIMNESEGKVNVLSFEIFAFHHATDRGVVANRIKGVFSPCKILITIRNQVDIIKSYFNSHERHSYMVKKEYDTVDFQRWMRYNFIYLPSWYLSTLHYYDLITYYCNLFDGKNIKVMLFEDFVHNKEVFIRELTDFLGVNYQEAVELLKGKHARAGNYSGAEEYSTKSKDGPLIGKYLRDIIYPRRKDEAAEIDMDSWMKKIVLLYGRGNKKLSGLFGLPLEKYHYPLYDGDEPVDGKTYLRQIPEEWVATPLGVE